MNYFTIPGVRKPQQTLESVINAVNDHFGIECRKKTQQRPYPEARSIAMYIVRKNPIYSLKAIGDAFGKDHTTVIHALSQMQNRIDTNDWIVDHYRDIVDRLKVTG